MVIKALSLWQPWASLVGPKTFETRPRKFNYRGPLLICAAKFKLTYDDLMELGRQKAFREALAPLIGLTKDPFDFAQRVHDLLPYGKAVATCDIANCFSTNSREWTWGLNLYEQMRQQTFGDFSKDRYALKLENIQTIKDPFPVRGQQGLFEVEIPEGLV